MNLSKLQETGQIDALTDWVIKNALNQLGIWKELGFSLGVAINVSAVNLKQKCFDSQVLNLITHSGCDASMITIEVTESALAEDPEQALLILIDY